MTDTGMPIGDSLLLSLVGMLFVFAILALLALIVFIMARVIHREAPAAQAAGAASVPVNTAAVQQAQPVPAVSQDAVTYVGDMKLVGVDDKEAVLIMAIAAENSGIPLGELCFKSIRAID